MAIEPIECVVNCDCPECKYMANMAITSQEPLQEIWTESWLVDQESDICTTCMNDDDSITLCTEDVSRLSLLDISSLSEFLSLS